ncbi:Nucleoside triphosphate pyrophosphohydrolase/pyrophosphatase MazG [Corynebacterium faecale]|uniref:MazG nucleotide pyrophosphohydrolase domain-containing protein n=1 Tax=Corynebacterium faecale TaxID=1758466 RepID=UPI0025B53023|nr:MazG nucleotide pyrophosphohydrolase domain-containing protein [Corynebacterium faecale]WJY91707.1 Nucleoside triphosphate pyrophosphohydrolase/pyrophosphatase MazG [Corynebacterium faecale]
MPEKTVLLIDSHNPVFPAEFLEAVLHRRDSMETDGTVGVDFSSWGITLAPDAPWFVTADASIAASRGGMLIDARLSHVAEAIGVMQRAVRQGEWEQFQTHHTLIPYLREETEEFIEAVEQTAPEDELLKELGDVFLQVLFHAEIAARRGAWDFSDVAASFVTKMRSRSPYLFNGHQGMVTVEEAERLWAEGKARETAG